MDAFEKIYILYKDDIWRFIYKLTDYNRQLSEELLAETFYQAFISFKRFRGTCEVKTWLCKIAKNTYKRYVRREISKDNLFERLKGFSGVSEENTGYTEVSGQIENRELLDCVRIILADCDKRAQDIVQYRMYAGLKFREIAGILGIKETTAKVIFCRTRMYIQIQLKERFGYEV